MPDTAESATRVETAKLIRAYYDAFNAGDSEAMLSMLADDVIHDGVYKNSEEGLPPAKGQKYVLPAGTFFAIRGGKITRVTTYYNLTDWMLQVSA